MRFLLTLTLALTISSCTAANDLSEIDKNLKSINRSLEMINAGSACSNKLVEGNPDFDRSRLFVVLYDVTRDHYCASKSKGDKSACKRLSDNSVRHNFIKEVVELIFAKCILKELENTEITATPKK